MPKYDEAWRIVQSANNRSRDRMNRRLSRQWEKRMRLAMSDLVTRNSAMLNDWLLVMRTLMRVGYVGANESVVKELPKDYRDHLVVLETRLGTIVRWLRNINDTRLQPKGTEVEIAHAAFWEVFKTIQDNEMEVSAFTLRLLLEASSELTNLIVELDQGDTVGRFDEILRYVFLHGYGLDLDYLPVSVEERALDKSRTFPYLSAKALNATMEQLRRRGSSAYQLLAIYDLLTTQTKASSMVGSPLMSVDEDDEEYPTLSAQTAAEESSGERINWLGFKVNAKDCESSLFHLTPVFDASTADTPAVEIAAEEVSQEPRHLLDYLPVPTPLHSVTAAPTFTPPPVKTWNANTIMILLQVAAQTTDRIPPTHDTAERFLMIAILEIAVHNVLTYNATWLSAYLACPAESRTMLKRPQRILPEWFRYVLGRQTNARGRNSARTKILLDAVLESNTHLINAIVAREQQLSSEPLHVSHGRVILPTPEYLGSLYSVRKWRNADVFIVSDELQSLYDDQVKLQHHLQRAQTVWKTHRHIERSRLERRTTAEVDQV